MKNKGRPEVLDNGTLRISNVLSIPGDIGLKTGHVEFDGHIEVAGSVQEGYCVNGKSLTADEILQADVSVEGNIIVSKGIIGATILTDGTVKARHRMAKLLEEQDQHDNRMRGCTSHIKNSEARIQKLQDEIRSIIKLAKMQKSAAIVKVSGIIYNRTSIQSPKVKYIAKRNLQRVIIQEVKKTDVHAGEKWEMIVSALK